MKRHLRLAGLAMAAATVLAVLLPASPANAADAEGYYEIVNYATRGCVDVRSEDGPYSNGARLQIYYCTGAAEQRWRPEYVGNGYYRLRVMRSGMCMDVRAAWTFPGADIQQWTCANVPQQHWRLVWQPGLPPGVYMLQAEHSGMCVELAGGNGSPGTFLWQNYCHPWYAQLWQFR
jgi:Ricin-type beta-trefoil lectin domain-like